MDFETYNELCYRTRDSYPEEPDYEEYAEWDDWTDEEIQEFLAEDLADEMRLQTIIERGEAE